MALSRALFVPATFQSGQFSTTFHARIPRLYHVSSTTNNLGRFDRSYADLILVRRSPRSSRRATMGYSIANASSIPLTHQGKLAVSQTFQHDFLNHGDCTSAIDQSTGVRKCIYNAYRSRVMSHSRCTSEPPVPRATGKHCPGGPSAAISIPRRPPEWLRRASRCCHGTILAVEVRGLQTR